MLLGGTGLMCGAVETAKRLGIYTIVTDYFPNSPAKEIADKRYDISTTDIEALVRMAQEEKIDGVFTGFLDVNLYSARALCDRLGLPFYATREQLELTTNKLKFKQLCRKYGIPTVKQYELDAACKQEQMKEISYPVMVKPADSYASKGCSMCTNERELIEAVKKALSFSPSGQIIVEQYMDPNQYHDFAVYYTAKNGDIRLSAMSDRKLFIGSGGVAPLPVELRMPSRYLADYCSKVNPLVQRMFREENVKNGTIFMQGFFTDTSFCFFEMGFRLNGAQEYIFITHATGNNALELYIHHALAESSDAFVIEKENPAFPFCACNLVVLLNPGVIAHCSGLKEIQQMPGVLHISQLMKPGDTVGQVGTLQQVFARIHIVGKDWSEVDHIISAVKGRIKVEDSSGNNLIVKEDN